mmetsp:Transcript_78638/g.225318  ORF Transcript_78638/g.225318 Transcript_78638/m.225318 type:complete len:238 (+) Transcript_78638:112-825(+)
MVKSNPSRSRDGPAAVQFQYRRVLALSHARGRGMRLVVLPQPQDAAQDVHPPGRHHHDAKAEGHARLHEEEHPVGSVALGRGVLGCGLKALDDVLDAGGEGLLPREPDKDADALDNAAKGFLHGQRGHVRQAIEYPNDGEAADRDQHRQHRADGWAINAVAVFRGLEALEHDPRGPDDAKEQAPSEVLGTDAAEDIRPAIAILGPTGVRRRLALGASSRVRPHQHDPDDRRENRHAE